MFTHLNLLIHISSIGFFTAWIGTMVGLLLCFITTDNDRRVKGTVLGFLGGLMLAIICFDLIPESFENSNVYIATLGIFIGLITALLLDSGISHHNFEGLNSKRQRHLKVAFFMAIGTGLHNIRLQVKKYKFNSHCKNYILPSNSSCSFCYFNLGNYF